MAFYLNDFDVIPKDLVPLHKTVGKYDILYFINYHK